jgi:diguanylate cyclase
MLDIDHFKKCNDTYGHLFGDKVIRRVAQVITKNVKGQDLPARIGGEEFAILLPDTPVAGALALAERIRMAVERGRIKRGDGAEAVGNITISLGVAEYAPGETLEAFILRADQALYASKAGGRNRVTHASSLNVVETAPRPTRAA